MADEATPAVGDAASGSGTRNPSGNATAIGVQRSGDLVMVHVPFNFGHTIEKVALLGTNASSAAFGALMKTAEQLIPVQAKQAVMGAAIQHRGEQWGTFYPGLVEVSKVTGCPLYLTPQKHWPRELQDRYLGNRTIFGLLRDPYERLVSIFRGDYPKYFSTCDVNGAVKLMMRRYLSGDRYWHGCVFLPQAEYFEGGAYNITLPIDNRYFPASVNAALLAHGYDNMLIGKSDIMHVDGCSEVWPGDLDQEARRLVRQVYARDFELLCKHFGHCDPEENVCLRGVPGMCPRKVAG